MMLRQFPLSGLIAIGFVLGSAIVTQAQTAPPIDKSLVKAALLLRLFDQYSAQCQTDRGFNSSETTTIEQWQTVHHVAAVRTQIRTIPTDMQTQIEAGAATMAKTLQQRFPEHPCVLATNITTLTDAQFAKTLPRSTSPKLPTLTPPTSIAPAPSNNSNTTNLANLVGTIDSFGFATSTGFGVGGVMTQEVEPVVLFSNGEALKDVKGLTDPGGLEAHRQAKPQKWTQWRRNNGRVELMGKKGWKKLPFSATYPALPADFRLSGSYRSLSGAGNVAIGGSTSVAAWRNYTFTADGQVLRGSGAGASSDNVAISSAKPNQRGRYEINGLILRMRYDDGSIEERIIITNPQDAKSAIWLDGVGYSKRK
jgi:hypothetical protein